MRHEKLLRGCVVGAFVLGLLVMGSSASAQVGPASHPKWVARNPSAGLIPTWTIAAADTAGRTVIPGVSLIECVATTETQFSCWSGKLRPVKSWTKWAIYSPGVASTDTLYTVPAGETRTYRFDKPWVQYIYLKTGTATFSGE